MRSEKTFDQTSTTAIARCPLGKVVLSGGHGASDTGLSAQPIFVEYSQPADRLPNGHYSSWYVYAEKSSIFGGSWSATAYVLCVPTP